MNTHIHQVIIYILFCSFNRDAFVDKNWLGCFDYSSFFVGILVHNGWWKLSKWKEKSIRTHIQPLHRNNSTTIDNHNNAILWSFENLENVEFIKTVSIQIDYSKWYGRINVVNSYCAFLKRRKISNSCNLTYRHRMPQIWVKTFFLIQNINKANFVNQKSRRKCECIKITNVNKLFSCLCLQFRVPNELLPKKFKCKCKYWLSEMQKLFSI